MGLGAKGTVRSLSRSSRRLITLVAGAFLLLNAIIYYAVLPRQVPHTPSVEQQQQDQQGHANLQQTAAAAADSSDILYDRNTVHTQPGGADAELLCLDRRRDCTTRECAQYEERKRTWECKATCGVCQQLAQSIHKETGLQVRVVLRPGPCQDLHPRCAKWAEVGRCTRQPASMLELCQASCRFCATPAVPAGSIVLTEQPAAAAAAAGLLHWAPDQCQDDISVCPFLSRSGLCSSSTWARVQCPSSCAACRQSNSGQAGLGSSKAGQGSQATASRGPVMCGVPHLGAVGGASPGATLQGAAAGGATDTTTAAAAAANGHAKAPNVVCTTLTTLQRPRCDDQQKGCSDWAKSGECTKNPDYMAATCPRSCGACAEYLLPAPFKSLALPGGHLMPALGFGTAGLGEGTQAAVASALQAGYRMLDTAESPDWYKEEAVGQALAAAGYTAGAKRQQVFLISKLHPRDHGRDKAAAAVARSLQKLQTQYIDLYLLHYPRCWSGLADCPRQVDWSAGWPGSWRALEELHAAGKVRNIGVSNWNLQDMQELLGWARVRPAVLEARSDPLAANTPLLSFCLQRNITFISYSSLGSQWGWNGPNPVLTHPVLKGLASSHNCSVAQVVLAWGLHRGQVVIPRSSSPKHQRENYDAWRLRLSPQEVAAINALDGTRAG